MPIKTTRSYLTLVQNGYYKKKKKKNQKKTKQEKTNVGKDGERREPLCTVAGLVIWYCPYGKYLKIELPYDAAISLIGIYLKKMTTLT